MICIKCGHANPDHLNYCEKCNAYIFKMGAGQGAAPSVIDLEEGKQYFVPERSYPTEYLYNLTCRAYEYIHENAPGEPLLEAYEVVRTKLDEMEEQSLPGVLEGLNHQRLEDPEDDFPRQMAYLINKGVLLYREGTALMDEFIANGENSVLIDAVTRMQEGNDNFGLALEMGQAREMLIAEELNRREQAERAAALGGAAEARVQSGDETAEADKTTDTSLA